MEKSYSAYEKTINGTTFYFVKQYRVFPEYKNVPPLLETYGMHTDFQKACGIASIHDEEVQQELAGKLGLFESYETRQTIEPAHYRRAEIYSLKLPEFHFPFISKLIRLR
jgi:hypothetical protein